MSKGKNGRVRGRKRDKQAKKAGSPDFDKQMLKEVGRALEELKKKGVGRGKRGGRKDLGFHGLFVGEMTGLLAAARKLPRMTAGELAGLQQRVGAFITGLRAGAVAMQGELPPTDDTGGTSGPATPCADACIRKFNECLERAEKDADELGRETNRVRRLSHLLARELKCLFEYGFCIDDCIDQEP
jgi:hypothetical protein